MTEKDEKPDNKKQEAKPAEQKPAADTKAAEAKPAADAKAAEQKPAADAKATDKKPEADAKAGDAKSADQKPAADAKEGEKKDGKEAKKGGKKGEKGENPDGKEKKKFSIKNAFKKKSKAPKEEKPKVPYVDKPDKPEMSSVYVHKVVKLDKKNNTFSDKAFQKVRKVSSIKRNLEAFKRIGTCLNDVDLTTLPTDCINKVCFILMNTYPGDSQSLGVGPTNDAYLMALIHHKLGYKIAFLINSDLEQFTNCLEFFVANTTSALTIFYSGHDSSSKIKRIGHGIDFGYNDRLSSIEFGEIVGGKSNGQSKIIIISDVGCGRSIFSMKAATSTDNAHCSDMVSFSIDKRSLTPKERRRTQGLFTYYFCKLLRQFPNSTAKEMVDMLNISFERFKETFTTLVSTDDLNDRPLFAGAEAAFNSTKTKRHPKKAAGKAPAAAQAPAAAPAASPAPAAAPAANA